MFDPPALSHIRYAHVNQREQALKTLKQLGQELQEGRTLYVHGEQWSFATPRGVYCTWRLDGVRPPPSIRMMEPSRQRRCMPGTPTSLGRMSLLPRTRRRDSVLLWSGGARKGDTAVLLTPPNEPYQTARVNLLPEQEI